MKTSEVRALSAGECDQKVASLRKELYDLRAKAQSGQLEKPHQVKVIRRTIARIMTLKQEAELKETKQSG
jgi:large subunit ribosomal protein L29